MNEIVYGKLSSKSQTVIPKTVRKRLGLKPGDMLRFRIADDQVTIDKVSTAEDDPFVTFVEWNAEDDDRLYRDL
jgi:antitoxin PrlF